MTLEIRTRLPKHIQLLIMCQYHAHAHTVKRRPARPRDIHSYTFRHLFWPARPSVILKSRSSATKIYMEVFCDNHDKRLASSSRRDKTHPLYVPCVCPVFSILTSNEILHFGALQYRVISPFYNMTLHFPDTTTTRN